jgi:glutamate racemase
MNGKAIGVFDSGIGGLTVYRALKQTLPRERVIYLGDTARLPYGSKSPEAIVKFSEQNAAFLMSRQVKIIVVACNSSSSYAVPHLREILDIPVIGVIEPGAEAAVTGGGKKIGVIGTTATISSGAYERAIRDRDGGVEILSKDCPLFVPLVEEGWIDHPVTRMVVEEYLLPMKADAIDTLVLGCTHYPVLKSIIQEVVGREITLIDSAETTARKVAAILEESGWLSSSATGEDEFYATDFPERFKRVGEIFLRRTLDSVESVVL